MSPISLHHQPVLIKEIVHWLKWTDPGMRIGDFTVGGGGHLKALLESSPRPEKVIALDQDLVALSQSKKTLEDYASFIEFHQMNFREVHEGKWGSFDRILLDLGVSSFQLDDSERGFSFQRNGPLDFRMNSSQSLSAEAWLKNCTDDEFVRVLRDYGEEGRARYFLRRLREAQKRGAPLRTTEELVEVLGFNLTSRDSKGRHPLTRVFQALRIVVNDELSALEDILTVASSLLRPRGRIGMISFHSLEDRRVKWAFRSDPALKDLFKKPIEASEEELNSNPRSRSAKFRVAEKIL